MTKEIEIAKPKSIEEQVSEWSKTDADLRSAVEATSGITIKSHAEGPKKGRAAVHSALMTLADCRVSIEKRREELKRPIIDLGKLVDSEAKRLTAITAPREAELRTDRDAYDAEEAKAKAEADRIAKEAKEAEERKAREEAQRILNEKVKRIAAAGGIPDLIWLAGAGDDEVDSFIARLEREKLEREEQAQRDAEEQARQEEIAAKNRAEAKRLADEREAFENAQRKAREAQERIDADRRRLEEAEQAKRDAEAEAERIKQEQAEQNAIKAAQATDREKIAAWATKALSEIDHIGAPLIADAELAEYMDRLLGSMRHRLGSAIEAMQA